MFQIWSLGMEFLSRKPVMQQQSVSNNTDYFNEIIELAAHWTLALLF
ncbi:MAG: hypothetical protein R3E08_14860 [Thiotrichaceae bacterium]